MIATFVTHADWQAHRRTLGGAPVGFVPTMGALHDGHRALFARARRENEAVVASIFVNPTQFDDPADLAKYPRTWEQDLALMDGLVDAVVAPTVAELYPDGYRYRVSERELSLGGEGGQRPGHFDGVLTVVLKLLNWVAPSRAYFGEKDWQQLQLVRGMARALFLPVEIVGCPTVRAPDGLALSSRNRRLSAAGRTLAAEFPRLLRGSVSAAAAAAALAAAGFAVDYVEDEPGMRVGAVRVEGLRLIDHVRL
jgi:pantoate--beta-alanine ligase